ncbi:MAG: CPBP family intramembrane metalloprotease [Chloroflexi bacterium]|nr:CPBP family intramembrane metalloprotease [Chloroflexota bacterium]
MTYHYRAENLSPVAHATILLEGRRVVRSGGILEPEDIEAVVAAVTESEIPTATKSEMLHTWLPCAQRNYVIAVTPTTDSLMVVSVYPTDARLSFVRRYLTVITEDTIPMLVHYVAEVRPQIEASPVGEVIRKVNTWAPWQLAMAYLALITLAEILTTIVEPTVGSILHSGVLGLLLLHSAISWELPIHRLLVTLSFAPLIRLISLSLPLAHYDQMYWYLITSIPLFVTGFMIMRMLKITLPQSGYSVRGWLAQALIALTGLALGYLEYRILRPQPLISELTLEAIWFPALILLFCTGVLEELLFRGIMQSTAVETLNHFGVWYVAIVFAVLHIGYQSVVDVLFVFLVGLFFGWIVLKTRNLVGVSLAHGLTNIMLFLVLPFVSGG